MYDEDIFKAKVAAWLIGGVVLLVLLFTNFPVTWVPVGSRGIMMRLGTPTGAILNEGVSFKMPFIESVKLVEVRVQKKEVEASAASKDLQTVSSKVAVNFAVDPTRVIDLYRNIGDDFDDRIVAPAIQEAVKSVTARYTAEELITKRSEVSDTILNELKARIGQHGLLATDLNIVDFDFSKSFNDAIERKVTAEQNALASKNTLEQIKYEAEQAIATAKGRAESTKLQAAAEAEAIRIKSQALAQNPGLVELTAAERWNGQLPTTMVPGATLPFMNIR